MDVEVDHYKVLGLPSGEEGAKLTENDIKKAYRAKALVLHPDKRPDDPDAPANFQSLMSSYEILKDEKARKLFDDLLRVKRDQQRRHLERDAKRQRMVSDLEARERSAFAPDAAARDRAEEERIARKLKEEIERIRKKHAKKGAATAAAPKRETGGVGKENAGGAKMGLDEEKMLKVSWENVGEGYTAERLRGFFSEFGEVEDIVIRGKKKRGSALVVMATKDAAVAATGTLLGDLSNPLLVIPLKPVSVTDAPPVQRPEEPDRLNNLVGAGYQSFEDSVLEKLKKAGQKDK
ncbi:dnaJ subfamily C member 17-like [Pyrus ussuriensis x Pyrus communis]|uniref:DnaJ subfamily C member 17-like n=1 Tax=Pyrus ussuriensis x Pyrus communis TaxID=2448454 RepID=A0A5N5ICL7_9ROSA|nr:dnaJ subfamily C member 17-like [Pyrus ussuriensis x Pyrus communis]